MKRISAAGVVLAALVVCPTVSAADPEDERNQQTDEAAVALVTGAAVSFVSLGAGGVMVARGQHEFVKNTGFLGAQSGMMLAPFAAHAVVGETKRGLWWSLPLLVPLATSSVFFGVFPSLIKRAPAGVQYATFISFTISIIGSTLGTLDAVRVGERRPKKAASSLSLVPLIGGGTTGAMLSGSL